MARYSLDTNTLTYILRKNPDVVAKFEAALAARHDFLLCPFVYYESKRGLLAEDKKSYLSSLERIVSRFRWLEFEEGVWAKAMQGWAMARRLGRSPGDADLLIAAHALHFSAVLVTANVKDFEFFPGLQIENWAATGAGA
ncbi:MAG TPA: PIN domain-containing protein [Haliangium sp.]|nr:PIN domain-containing protein [Haliangium sp.]